MKQRTAKVSIVSSFLVLLGALAWLGFAVETKLSELDEKQASLKLQVQSQFETLKLSLADLTTRFDQFVSRFEVLLNYLDNHRAYPAPMRYWDDLKRTSDRWKVPVIVLCAIGSSENEIWDPNEIGTPNADGTRDYGLFQLNSKTIPGLIAKYWNRKEKFNWRNPEHNMFLAGAYLAENYALFGSWTKSICAYNAGPGWVQNNPSRYSAYFSRVQSKLMQFADNMIQERLNG